MVSILTYHLPSVQNSSVEESLAELPGISGFRPSKALFLASVRLQEKASTTATSIPCLLWVRPMPKPLASPASGRALACGGKAPSDRDAGRSCEGKAS